MTELTNTSPLPATYREALGEKENATWKGLARYTVGEASELWFASLANKHTARAYRGGFAQLVGRGLVNTGETLQAFTLRNHSATLDSIKGARPWSEATRQARAALWCAFTGFLARRSEGMIRKATPSREGTTKTFFKVRDKVTTQAMNRRQWERFLKALDKISARDGLIARLQLQGGKRISEVLDLRAEQIDWQEGRITFRQAKTGGRVRETVITYPPYVMEALRAYLGERAGLVFVTSSGQPIRQSHLFRNFTRAGERARISFPTTPHVLRASTVTYLKQEGEPDSEIMKVTGHTTAEMVNAYDKTERAENASRRVNLV